MATQAPVTPDEGTIRFAYALEAPEGPVAPPDLLTQLRGWRHVLRRLSLVGQDAIRYGGFGFGNLSARDPQQPGEFLITASQTSGVEDLEDADLVRITGCNPARFWVDAVGHQPPSSESLTHAMIYESDPAIAWIFHGHSPEIWEGAQALGVPAIPEEIAYGSAELADAMADLLHGHAERPLLFVTLGHRDGVFACGATARDAGAALVDVLGRAAALP